jgi:hypothetical protein
MLEAMPLVLVNDPDVGLHGAAVLARSRHV